MASSRGRRRSWGSLLLALVLLGLWLARGGGFDPGSAGEAGGRMRAPPVAPEAEVGGADSSIFEQGARAIAEAAAARRSGFMVSVRAPVARLLSDDDEGDRHQRFVLDLGQGLTVLVAHNLDLAPRVPVEPGDEVELRGQYEWNAKGGVLHWTHRDPGGRREGGWIRHRGRSYE